jgi:hypothetical protein
VSVPARVNRTEKKICYKTTGEKRSGSCLASVNNIGTRTVVPVCRNACARTFHFLLMFLSNICRCAGEEILNVFKLDPEYEANEEKYKVNFHATCHFALC